MSLRVCHTPGVADEFVISRGLSGTEDSRREKKINNLNVQCAVSCVQ